MNVFRMDNEEEMYVFRMNNKGEMENMELAIPHGKLKITEFLMVNAMK